MPVATCARHGEETRLHCSNCGEPICPRCAVPTPVGQKCPACARQSPAARARGKPRQYAKAVGFGGGAAAATAVVLVAVIGSVGFFTWIASGVGGYAVARAVRAGAEGNGAPPFQWLSIGLAVVAVLAAWIGVGVANGVGPILVPPGLGVITYLAAAYGAWIVFR